MKYVMCLVIMLVTGCVQVDVKPTEFDDPKPNGYACSTSWGCESGQCLLLGKNAQNKTGICSAGCRNDRQCASDERCYLSDDGGFCLKSCAQGATCVDGFVCTGHEPSICFVEPKGAVSSSCTTSVYGSCQNAARTECVEKAGISDSDRAKDEAACTATSGAVWSDGPCPLLDLVAGCRLGCSPSNQVTWHYSKGPYATREAVDAHCKATGLTTVSLP